MVLASIRDQYRHFGFFIEYLLDATIVYALLATGRLRLADLEIIIVLIFAIGQARNIVWGLGRDGRRRFGGVVIVRSFKIERVLLEERYDVISPHGGEKIVNLRGETAPECSASDRWPSGRSKAP